MQEIDYTNIYLYESWMNFPLESSSHFIQLPFNYWFYGF